MPVLSPAAAANRLSNFKSPGCRQDSHKSWELSTTAQVHSEGKQTESNSQVKLKSQIKTESNSQVLLKSPKKTESNSQVMLKSQIRQSPTLKYCSSGKQHPVATFNSSSSPHLNIQLRLNLNVHAN